MPFLTFYVLFISYFNVYSFSKVHSCATYFSQACRDQDSWRTNCIHSFSWPSMKLVACLVHSNRGEKEAFIFISPHPTGNQASGQNAMKSLFRRHLAGLNGKKFTSLICPQITVLLPNLILHVQRWKSLMPSIISQETHGKKIFVQWTNGLDNATKIN